MQRWNHVNLAVAPERMPLVEECLDALFGWEKFVTRSTLIGWRLGPDLHDAALYLRPVAAAGAVGDAIIRLRAGDAALDAGLAELDGADADWRDHTGFQVGSVAEWEDRLAHATRLAAARPDLQIAVVDVLRPGDGRAATDYLYQAFIRVGLLGPLRNTFEMQARRA